MKLIDKLPYFPMYAKDYLWECKDYDLITFGVKTKLVLETWIRQCKWLNDFKEDVPKILGISKKDYKHAKKHLAYRHLAKNGDWRIDRLEDAKKEAINRHLKAQRAANIRHKNL